ncbi:hypothetical protein BH23ACT12_BH23ACT12_24200 [soil metagenome]
MLDRKRMRVARITLLLLITGLAVAMSLYQVLMETGRGYSAALFIGIPAIVAIAVVLSPPAKSLVGSIFRAITILLALAGIFAVEGFVCIVMVSPLFYLIGWAIGYPLQRARNRRAESGPPVALMVFLPLLLIGMEGMTPGLSFDRSASASAVRQVNAAPAEVEAALAGAPRFDRPLPAFLKLGFPIPAGATGTGLNVGAVRSITFAECHHPESRTRRPVTARLTMRVAESEPGRVVFVTVRDTTLQGRWAELKSSEVRWVEAPGGRTTVIWTLNYDRQLDPAFYFGPLQQYGMGTTAGYLIDTLATPS